MAKIQDDRTWEQRGTHRILIVGTDRFMSRLGQRAGVCQQSFAAWACRPEDADSVEKWVRSRGDMTRVRRATDRLHPQKGVHVHIYVVDAEHPALGGER